MPGLAACERWLLAVSILCFVCARLVCAEILEGGVKIIQNKYLSFASQINWLDIVKDSTPDIVIEDNGPQSESGTVCGSRRDFRHRCGVSV